MFRPIKERIKKKLKHRKSTCRKCGHNQMLKSLNYTYRLIFHRYRKILEQWHGRKISAHKIREEKFLKLKKDIPIQKQKESIHSMDSCLAIFITILFTITRK